MDSVVERQVRRFAAKYTADHGIPESSPSDEELKEAFQNCVKPIDIEHYGAIRDELVNFQTEKLIEQYLLFMRGRGPEPSVPEDRREEITTLFELIAMLADRDPSLPELGDDPVAIRLGLVKDD